MRPTRDQSMMEYALVAARRSTCIRRAVGCVLADANGHELAIAHNGVASGLPHCNEGHPCPGHDLPPGQDSCEGVHAEQNAILKCKDPYKIHTAYITTSPCKPCLKLLLNTSCKRIVFLEELEDTWPRDTWLASGNFRTWEKLVCKS